LLEVNCDRRSVAEIQEAVRVRAARTKAGEWVLGYKYDDTKLKDGRPPTRADLDAAAPGHPVRVVHRGGHTCVCNSLAVRLADVDRKTPDPEGGKFGRDDKGELTGFVAEKANAVFDRLARPKGATAKQRQAAVKLISEQMTAAGLTSVHDAMCGKDHFVA